MVILGIGIMFVFAGYIMLYLLDLFQWYTGNFLTWGIVLSLLFLGPWIYTLWRINTTNTWKHVDKLPTWKHLIDYMRRDNQIVPLIGERAYPGESFLDVKELGLIEYLGKDCFYNWGDKKIVWGLENINYTPDPRYFNLTHLLYSIGFTDSNDIKKVLNGEDLELMGKIYLKMQEYDGKRGATKLITEMKEYDGEVVEFKPTKEYERAIKLLDKKEAE